jgi:protoporphyrinogen oxidase
MENRMPDAGTRKTAVIIGAGPAGLTAALELLERTDLAPLILEETSDLGGICKTLNYKGNRFDMGGHRFFSKHDRVMAWWLRMLPMQGAPARDDRLLGRALELSREPGAPDPEAVDPVMLLRRRLSRILYRRRFFDYPVSLNANTVRNLGLLRMLHIGFSYLRARLFPIRPERSLEDFIVNRFGRELYATFFKDYTEKVWGIPPSGIKPDWGAQRIKGLSITKVLLHALRGLFRRKPAGLAQKDTETSLIEQFLYPKLGPGQMWDEVARRVEEKGGRILMRQKVLGLRWEGPRVTAVKVRDQETGEERELPADCVFSSMPVKDLVAGMGEAVPAEVRRVAAGLMYRDYMTVGLLAKRLKIRNQTRIPTLNGLVPDLWVYVQESDVKLGRLQIYNNWSPYMVADPDTVWLGLEYFCQEGDGLWRMPDADFAAFAADELARVGVIEAADVLDAKVVRIPKTYPAYFGTYDEFGKVQAFLSTLENLYPVGRNGMHKYNNTDHSMLTAMTAVDNIVNGVQGKDNLWAVNTEEEYHEEKKPA